MAIVTSNLGPNSAYVVYTGGETNANIAAAVYTWLQNHGWELHDDAASASSKVFKALCIDATTYKYMMIGYDSNGIYMRVFEGWNASTHAGTNETWYSGQAAVRTQRTELAGGGYVYVFATQHYCVLYSKTNSGLWGDSGLQSWSGCFEISEDGRDTRNLPVFGWTNGYSMMGGNSSARGWGAASGPNYAYTSGTFNEAISNWFNNSSSLYSCFSLPKTTLGSTGSNADKFVTVGCALGLTTAEPYTLRLHQSWGSWIGWQIGSNSNSNLGTDVYDPQGNVITTGGEYRATANGYNTYKTIGIGTKLIDVVPSTNNGLTSTPWAITPWVYEMGNTTTTLRNVTEPRGKMFGIKLLQKSLGNFMDTITIVVDNNGFMEIGGTDSTHHVITAGPGMPTARFAIPT